MKKLYPGATIGIINPAFKNPSDVFEKYDYMVKFLEEAGYKVKFGKTYTAAEGYLAGSDELRAKDVEEMFLDKEVDAIVCMRGGYGCSRMIDMIDFNIIKDNPKILCGFSDVTVLLNSIYRHTGLPSMHGLVGIYLGSKRCNEFTNQSFWDAFTKPQKGRILKNPDDVKAETLVEGVAEGVIVGGNLSLIATLVGSDYEVDFTDKIVFIEEVTEEPYAIDRYLSAIRLRGMLEKAKGFVFGYFSQCEPGESKKGTQTYMDLIKEYVGSLGKPVITNFACGHDFPFVTLPIGVKVKMDANEKTIEILEEIYETSAN